MLYSPRSSFGQSDYSRDTDFDTDFASIPPGHTSEISMVDPVFRDIQRCDWSDRIEISILIQYTESVCNFDPKYGVTTG